MPRTLAQFAKSLQDSELMTGTEVRELLYSLATVGKPTDAETFAKYLVSENRLTRFQAQKIWNDEGRSLTVGDYLILDRIGRGGMGLVFRARHRMMKRVVALKLLPPSMTHDAKAIRRFLHEVEVAAKLTHSNIVAAYDAGESKGAYFLTMEYVDGRDLSTIVKTDGPATIAQAVDWTLQAAKGLAYAHAQGVIHRDIKPSNLLLDQSGTVKILDMGIARLHAANQARQDDQEESSEQDDFVGTVEFISPEQALNAKSAGPQADIYSLGATLCFFLTQKGPLAELPFSGKLRALGTGEGLANSLKKARPDVPEELDEIFRKMTAHRLQDRYKSMEDLTAALELLDFQAK